MNNTCIRAVMTLLWLGREGERERGVRTELCACLLIREVDISPGNFRFQMGFQISAGFLMSSEYSACCFAAGIAGTFLDLLFLLFLLSWMLSKVKTHYFFVSFLGIISGFLSFFFFNCFMDRKTRMIPLGCLVCSLDSPIPMEYSWWVFILFCLPSRKMAGWGGGLGQLSLFCLVAEKVGRS